MPKITLSFYLARHFLKWILIVGLTITALVLLIEFSEIIRKSSSKAHIGFNVLLQMLFLKVPSFIEQIFPFIVLFSSILTLWNLNRHQEMLVMKISGLSIWQILAPLMTVVWILGFFDMTAFQPIASQMMKRYESLDNQYFGNMVDNIVVAESGVWIQEKMKNTRRIYHIEYIDRQLKTAHNVDIFEYRQEKFEKRFQVKEIYFQEKFLILRKSWSQVLQSKPHYQEELNLPTTLSIDQFQNNKRHPTSISFWDLPNTSKMLEQSGLSGHKYDLYWHSLIARWIWLGIMVILAASCALRPVREQGTAILISTGALSAFILYFLRDITYALGNSGTLPIILAAWIPVSISALLAITVLLHFEEG
ncbi:MAG: LptF/LptG family permease [Janthinobacterium lividum]